MSARVNMRIAPIVFASTHVMHVLKSMAWQFARLAGDASGLVDVFVAKTGRLEQKRHGVVFVNIAMGRQPH